MCISVADDLIFFLTSAGIGAFIDFYIGKSGQRRIKNWIESLWIKLDDVKISTFSKNEAKMANIILKRIFGSFFSGRRLFSLLIVSIIGGVIWIVGKSSAALSDEYYVWSGFFNFGSESWMTNFIPIRLMLAVGMFWISISSTIFISKLICVKIPSKTYLSVPAFAIMIIIQIYFLVVAAYIPEQPLQQMYEGETIYESVHRTFTALENPISGMRDWKEKFFRFDDGWQELISYICFFLGSFPNLLRLGIAIIFFVSIVFRPLQKSILITLERIAESEKPIFTLVFGGVAGILKIADTIFST